MLQINTNDVKFILFFFFFLFAPVDKYIHVIQHNLIQSQLLYVVIDVASLFHIIVI